MKAQRKGNTLADENLAKVKKDEKNADD